MWGPQAFGVSAETLRSIGHRHVAGLAVAERLALQPLAHDNSVDPLMLGAFMKWRAVAALYAACQGNDDEFFGALAEGRRLASEGLL